MKVLVGSALAALLALGLSGCAPSSAPDGGSPSVTASSCPSDLIPVDLRMPEPSQVKLNLFNASRDPGLALTVLLELGQRRLQVLSVADSPSVESHPEAVVIRYGPGTVGHAWLLTSYFRGQVRTDFDANRADDTVDVILGQAFESVSTLTEVNQAVAAAGAPTAPPGTCPTAR